MALRPLRDKVVVKPSEGEDKTAGGIFLPDSAKKKPQEGKSSQSAQAASSMTARSSRSPSPSAIPSSIPSMAEPKRRSKEPITSFWTKTKFTQFWNSSLSTKGHEVINENISCKISE